MLHTAFYDPTKTYEENYVSGPFGFFSDKTQYKNKGNPTHSFLGHKVHMPFGIPAGPLLNSKFCKAAFEKGFDICVYKTVRSDFYPCHSFPNILPIHHKGMLTHKKLNQPLVVKSTYSHPISITNSFGVPSKKPEEWQEDVKKAISYAKKGQVLILSFMGTVRPSQTEKEFINDYVLAAKLANQTGAKILEVNLSCPNIGNEGLVCYNLEATKKIIQKIRTVIGNTPLILKVGFYKNIAHLKQLAQIANEYANSIALINTMQAAIVTRNGQQALPGNNRLRSGVCGTGIKWAGLSMVKALKEIKDKYKFTFSIEGVGGVTQAKDYEEYRRNGADSVMSATGAMWNPFLAQEVKEKYL